MNGPARCWNKEEPSKPGTPKFSIHFLVEGEPVCKFKTQKKFIEMTTPIEFIADWKKCPKCFAPGKKE